MNVPWTLLEAATRSISPCTSCTVFTAWHDVGQLLRIPRSSGHDICYNVSLAKPLGYNDIVFLLQLRTRAEKGLRQLFRTSVWSREIRTAAHLRHLMQLLMAATTHDFVTTQDTEILLGGFSWCLLPQQFKELSYELLRSMRTRQHRLIVEAFLLRISKQALHPKARGLPALATPKKPFYNDATPAQAAATLADLEQRLRSCILANRQTTYLALWDFLRSTVDYARELYPLTTAGIVHLIASINPVLEARHYHCHSIVQRLLRVVLHDAITAAATVGGPKTAAGGAPEALQLHEIDQEFLAPYLKWDMPWDDIAAELGNENCSTHVFMKLVFLAYDSGTLFPGLPRVPEQ